MAIVDKYYFHVDGAGNKVAGIKLSYDDQIVPPWYDSGFYTVEGTSDIYNAGNCVYASGNWTITPIDSAVELSHAKTSKLESLQDSRDAEIFSTFPSSALGTVKTYNYNLEAWTNFGRKASQVALSPSITSVTWANLEDGFVSHTRDQFIQLVMDGSAHEENAKMKYFTLEAQVNAATDIASVNAILW